MCPEPAPEVRIPGEGEPLDVLFDRALRGDAESLDVFFTLLKTRYGRLIFRRLKRARGASHTAVVKPCLGNMRSPCCLGPMPQSGQAGMSVAYTRAGPRSTQSSGFYQTAHSQPRWLGPSSFRCWTECWGAGSTTTRAPNGR